MRNVGRRVEKGGGMLGQVEQKPLGGGAMRRREWRGQRMGI